MVIGRGAFDLKSRRATLHAGTVAEVHSLQREPELESRHDRRHDDVNLLAAVARHEGEWFRRPRLKRADEQGSERSVPSYPVGDHDRTRIGEAIAPPVRRRRTGRQCDSPRISRIGAVERCDHGRIRVEVSPLPLSRRRHRTAGQVAPPSSRGRLPPAYPRAPTLGRLANQRR